MINLLFSLSMSFAFWASTLSGNQTQIQSTINLGQWYEGDPIFSPVEFLSIVTTPNNTGTYVLAGDIDFSSIDVSSWTDNAEVVFSGSFDGNGYAIKNLSKNNIRGIFGVLEGATIKNLTIENTNLTYSPTAAITSGILAGRIQGTNNLIENITIKNSSMTNSYPVGSIAGLIQPAAGSSTTVTGTIRNIKVDGATLTGGFNDVTYGSGGIVGTLNNANFTMEDLYFRGTISASVTTNIGGILGSTLTTGTVVINRAVVFADLINTASSTATTYGVGGIIGRNSGSARANHTFFTGFLRSRVVSPSTNSWTSQSGILRGTTTGNAVIFTNSRSAQITLYRNTTNTQVAVTNQTSYDRMTGQKAAYTTLVYRNLRDDSLEIWWLDNFSTITNSPLWIYDPTIDIYILKDN